MSEVSDVIEKDVVACVVDELENFKKSKINRESVYKPKSIKLKHSEVPEYIYNHIQPVDFRSEAGLIEDKDKLSIRHFLFTCIENIRETVDETGLGMCYRDGLVYMYNGEYWKRFPIPSFQSFLGKSAVKMGVTKFLGGIYSFKEQLAKQFMSVAHMDDFDDDSDSCEKAMINLSNGTFDIEGTNMRLRKPRKEDFLTYQLKFAYDENARCPMFNDFLDTVLPDKSLQMILAEYIGYLFIKTEDLKLEKVLLLYGSGANGKSVVFEIVYALLGGKSNVSNFSLENLTNANGYHRAMLAGKLLNYSTEINGKLNESVFKQLASGEPVDARVPYGDPFTITNYGKMMFNCNALPNTTDHSDAFYRRFQIIPFDVTIPKEKQDKQLARKIINKELPGVLNWVLEGLKRLVQQRGFTESEQADSVLNDYRVQGDSVALFVDEMGYRPSNESISLTDLHNEYSFFCKNRNLIPETRKIFSLRLKNQGIAVKRKNYGMSVLIEKEFTESPTLATLSTPF
ncbi:MAG: phage/plasmid primase, P4 family [Fermentimonas sp.]|nr:phage/plasmid primase, P4 family [Fermentimonas sp.]